MKSALFFLLIGAILGAVGWRYYQRTQNPSPGQRVEHLTDQTRDAAQQIISRKGATYYAVAAGLMRIVEAIVRDQRTVLSVSSLVHDYYDIADVCLSLPTVVCRSGVEWVLRLNLSEKEVAALQHSAQVLKETRGQLAIESLSH